jgi:hypothetical protein
MKSKEYHSVRKVKKSNRENNRNRGENNTPKQTLFVLCCIYLTIYDWIKSFLKITIERRAIYGNLVNKINTLYLARRKFHS